MDSDVDGEIRRLLTETHTWAVVGLSANTFRPAYGVARFLQTVGKRIVPVHPRAETVHGEVGYPTLADIPFEVDVVDVFVNSRRGGRGAGAVSGPDDGDEPVPGDRVAPAGPVARVTVGA